MIYILNLDELIVYFLKISLVHKIIIQKFLDDALKRVYCKRKRLAVFFAFSFTVIIN